MLAPMCLARPERAWYLAALTTVTSVLGGLLGYAIGYFLFEELGQPLIDMYNAQDKFDKAKLWFDEYGVWVVFLAGFSPIPYKLFTVTLRRFVDGAVAVYTGFADRPRCPILSCRGIDSMGRGEVRNVS